MFAAYLTTGSAEPHTLSGAKEHSSVFGTFKKPQQPTRARFEAPNPGL